MAVSEIIAKGADGYYRPQNEAEVVALVKYAVANTLQIRVRGASHSTAWSIFTDPVGGLPVNRTLTRRPPAGSNLDLSLDRMNGLAWIDEAQGVVEAEAGIHLGADPYNPLGRADLDNSLLFQLFEKGWGLNDLGGITHQTVAGFLSTGSSGGSLIYELNNVVAFRVIDGRGEAAWIEKGDPQFDAISVSVGLLGIITKVRLKCNRSFRVVGDEVTTPPDLDQCPIDLFGEGRLGKPSMQQFLVERPYSRLLWWPQKGAERVVIWQADRVEGPPPPDYKPVPYQEFAPNLLGWIEQLVGSIFYTLLGNKGFGANVPKLLHCFLRFCHCVTRLWTPAISAPVAAVAATLVTLVLAVLLVLPMLFFILFPGVLARLFAPALGLFQPMTAPGKDKFDDFYWRSLCMDNTADDILMGTEFTEIWIPLKYSEQCMDLMRDMFVTRGVPATGWFSTEVYAAMPSSAWLSAAYSDGQDDYKDGVIRFDIFWFRGNSGEPNVEGGFYQQYWDLFRDNGIPFRLHWGKYVPAYDFPEWAEYYRTNLPRFDDFMKLRAERDPNGIFFTSYWRQRFTGTA